MMNRFLLLLPLAMLATVPHAAPAKSRVGFVNVSKVMAAVPGSSNYLTLRKNADSDMLKRQQSIQTLALKASQSGKAADRTAVTKAQQDYLSAQKNYQTKLAAAFKPLATKVNTAIAKTAKSSGFSVVLDQQVAGTTKLVVYADASTDLTAAVIKALK